MRVGIDLGTTYSLVGKLAPDGRPHLVPDQLEVDLFHTPSVVSLTANSAMVGKMAELLLEQNPDTRVIRFFKRHFGEVTPLVFDDQGAPWFAESIAALVLKKLKYDAESFSSQSFEGAVITVPAHFNDLQRKAVHSAAMFADIPLLGLVEEPVAAAMHYGLSAGTRDQVVLVYDFGGGTFDATVLDVSQKGFFVRAKAGLTDVGGKELDEAVGELILAQFERALGQQLSLNARALLELRRVSESIKIQLGLPGRKIVRQTILLSGRTVEVVVRRSEFEGRIQSLIDLTEREVLRCLRDSSLRPSEIDTVLLVGGSSMVPIVADRLRRIFENGSKVMFHEPTKAVALGACIYAAILNGDAEKFKMPKEFRGVTGYSVGVRAINPETGRVEIDTVIKQNMTLPARAKKTYYTTRPQQDRIILEIVQSRSADEPAIQLGRLVVGPLPSPKQNYPIEVTIEYREDGTVALRAYDANTGVELNQSFRRPEDTAGPQNALIQRALVRSTLINNF